MDQSGYRMWTIMALNWLVQYSVAFNSSLWDVNVVLRFFIG